jgi:hypothetical protein
MSASPISAPTIDDRLHASIRDLRSRFGDGLLEDRRRLTGLLGDHVPEARREIRLVGLSMDDGVPAELRRLPPDQLPLQVQRLATRLENQYGIRPDFAHWVIAFWIRALGLAAPPGFEAGRCLPQEGGEGTLRPVAAAPPPSPAHTPQPAAAPQAGGLMALIGGAKGIAAGAALLVAVTAAGFWLGAGEPPAPAMQASPRPAPQPAPQAATAQAPAPALDPTPAPLPETYAALAPGQGAQTPEAPVTWVPGRSLTARFTVPGSPIRYTVTLRAGEGAEWTATDPAGRRSRGTGSLDRGAPDANGNAWDWSRVAWMGENALNLQPLCLAAFAGRPGGGADPHGGFVCLYDQSCAASYGCLRMRTR